MAGKYTNSLHVTPPIRPELNNSLENTTDFFTVRTGMPGERKLDVCCLLITKKPFLLPSRLSKLPKSLSVYDI
jgi:hypothetical protein